jgi:5'-deoxynucleotidase YfbR-like HD superfamily hydrolase
MHDAEEGLIKDLRSPLKALVGPRYLEIQRRVRRAINEKLGLQQMVENCTDLLFYIKRADIAVLHAEKRDLMVDAPMPWPTEALGISASIQHIKPVEPVVSYERWMSTFQYLSAAAKEELEQ